MRKFHKRLILITLILVIFLPLETSYADVNDGQIDISTSPEKVLFDLTDLKPGDRAERTLTIYNKGKQDFNYLTSNRLIEG